MSTVGQVEKHCRNLQAVQPLGQVGNRRQQLNSGSKPVQGEIHRHRVLRNNVRTTQVRQSLFKHSGGPANPFPPEFARQQSSSWPLGYVYLLGSYWQPALQAAGPTGNRAYRQPVLQPTGPTGNRSYRQPALQDPPCTQGKRGITC